jgi:hypothetical protein
MGCDHDQTRESLNEAHSHVSHRIARNDRTLGRVTPKDDLSSSVLDDLCGRSCERLYQKNLCRCEVHEIPKDGLSSSVQVGRNGRSFFRPLIYRNSFDLMKVGRCEVHGIPKGGLNEKLAYARLLNLSRVILNHESHYKKACLTSSFSPGGRRLVLRCVAYLTIRALELGHQILEHRRSFWCRALRGHRRCDEACGCLQSLEI